MEEPTRRSAMLDLVLTNREGLVGNMKHKDSLGCSDHQMGEFGILEAQRRAKSKLTTLGFWRADFGLFLVEYQGIELWKEEAQESCMKFSCMKL
ncbi:glycerol kinase [Pitangus sulphuratus]|nr:glycerol kinase [Pitangus sulphuratus]